MANVTGPTTRLPGHTRPAPKDQMCDEHPTIPAYMRVTGDVDSHGSEECDLCTLCFAQYAASVAKADTAGLCDWCKTRKPRISPARDFEEGMAGRVYDVCDECISKQRADIADNY